MNKQLENKKLFRKMVQHIEGCSDCYVRNHQGVIIERGMLLKDDYGAYFGLDDGAIRIYDNKHNVLLAFDENSPFLTALNEVFIDLNMED